MIRIGDFKSDELRASLFPEGVFDRESACDFFRRLFEPMQKEVLLWLIR